MATALTIYVVVSYLVAYFAARNVKPVELRCRGSSVAVIIGVDDLVGDLVRSRYVIAVSGEV